MSDTVPQIKNYYETYWSAGKQTFSGSNQGYAPNLRRWMTEELSDLPKTSPVLEVGCGDASFEVVWCSEVLEHLFDPAFALREMHRILKPGGRLLVTVPYHGRFKNILIALFNWDEHFVPSSPHIRFYTNRSLSRIAAAAGFRAIKIKTCGMGRPLRDLLVATNILLRATK